MSNDLFFLTPIADAYRQPHPIDALSEALRSILTKGQEPEYGRGMAQFLTFMQEVHKCIHDAGPLARTDANRSSEPSVASVNVSTDEEGPEEAALEEELQQTYGDLYPTRPTGLGGIHLKKDDALLEQFDVTSAPATFQVRHIGPGTYKLCLSTGRTVWEEHLTDRDLLWNRAHPGTPLHLAADSGEIRDVAPSRTALVLGGEIEIKVFAGLGSGRIQIVVHAPRRKKGTGKS